MFQREFVSSDRSPIHRPIPTFSHNFLKLLKISANIWRIYACIHYIVAKSVVNDLINATEVNSTQLVLTADADFDGADADATTHVGAHPCSLE